MNDARETGHPSRRDFLKECAAAAALAGAVAGVGGCALLRKTVKPDLILAAKGGEVRIPAASLPWNAGTGDSLAVEVAGRDAKVLVFRGADGAPRALDMACMHMGCDVAWAPDRDRMVCPCHGSEYAENGEVLHGPAKRGLAAHAVREEGGDLVIVLGS
jgi:cytochrome b6-f complex iron-sulfur subunit